MALGNNRHKHGFKHTGREHGDLEAQVSFIFRKDNQLKYVLHLAVTMMTTGHVTSSVRLDLTKNDLTGLVYVYCVYINI